MNKSLHIGLLKKIISIIFFILVFVNVVFSQKTKKHRVIPKIPKISLPVLMKPHRVTAQPMSIGTKFSGRVSFYHDKFEGMVTSNGERFSNKNYTCAHKSLPFGTMLEITKRRNGKSVVVRVNDRGPYVVGRILDLSTAAAKQIGLGHHGLAHVHAVVVGLNGVVTETTKTQFKENDNSLMAQNDGPDFNLDSEIPMEVEDKIATDVKNDSLKAKVSVAKQSPLKSKSKKAKKKIVKIISKVKNKKHNKAKVTKKTTKNKKSKKK